MKVLLTSTSFQDTPGKHQTALEDTEWDIVRMRGPLKENQLLDIIADIDIVICGDDEFTESVLKKGKENRLKGLSKYGVGLDSIDLDAAKLLELPVTNCPGVNQNGVAEHVFGLLLSYFRNIPSQHSTVQQYSWQRLVGTEVSDKTLGVFGLGSVGKEVAKKARAWGMEVYVLDKFMDKDFIADHNLKIARSIEDLVGKIDILSLNAPLNNETERVICEDLLKEHVKPGITKRPLAVLTMVIPEGDVW
ncbi:MAG: NAD(P)-dependent oxidoreductase [Bacteroidota bacterium]